MARKSRTQALTPAPDDEAEEPGSAAPRMKMNTPCAWDGDTLVVNILGTPAAKRDAIGKTKGHQLKVSVTATPVAGKATDHMVKFLAEEFDVPAKAITVVFGRFNVNKQLRILAPKKIPAVLAKLLQDAGP
ncbi:MAG: DUF167 family protein [Hydrogenophaga sp.]|jgi:hypothetical protein|uniref:DUF167 domain-containing protein n=1 Tax=Hydrogenophaga sp. TaxID=1904254 RepID=UPI000A8A86A6|nr:DUF167 family protein [Hydrogenophaga sp.]MCG2655166.1 DUF167 family protein [Hydrogenophaga sp.]MDZ4292917.1 DUF167 family protein [Hydrogenophaga sp.]